MEKELFENYDIRAFIPEYLKNVGEITRVIVTRGEDRLIYVTLRTFKANLCKHYSIDYASSRRKFGKIVGSVNCIPLPINMNKIYLQLKVRTPVFKGDCTMGYVDLNSIESCKAAEDLKGTEITLKDGRSIKVLYSVSTINKHIKNARLIFEYYKKERGYSSYPEALEKLYTGYDKPATKADIAILAREIATLKNSLKVY